LDPRSGYALPSSNPNAAETANPAGRHLSFAEICPDKRSQLSYQPNETVAIADPTRLVLSCSKKKEGG
jgi:hypothetical protein